MECENSNKRVQIIEVLQLQNITIATVDPKIGNFFLRKDHVGEEFSFVELFLRARSFCVGVPFICIYICITKDLVNFFG